MKLLLVDDSKKVLEELCKTLEPIPGIEIVGKARNEDEALQFFQSQRPDLVCLDIRLQLGSGLSILKRIKKDKPSTIIFMITNYPYDGYRRKCLELDAEFFFDKSKDIKQVVRIIDELANCGRNRLSPRL